MTPIDILPYYFAIEPAPTDDRSAFALSRPVADGGDMGVSVMVEDQDACTEIFRFSQLGFVHMAWSPCGSLLAFAHNSILMLRGPEGTIQMTLLPGDVQWLGFDRDKRIWSLTNERLEARVEGHVTAAIDSVKCAAVAHVAAYCRREDAGMCIYVHDGNSARPVARLPASEHRATVHMSIREHVLVVVAASAAAKGRLRLLIARVDLLTRAVDWLVDELVGFGLNGGPTIRAAASSNGEVLASYETGMFSRVWSLTKGQAPLPISPDGVEVFDFAVDPSGERLAVIASNPDSAIGVFERQLLLATRKRAEWRFAAQWSGVYQMPRWRHDGRLEILRGNDGRWTRHIYAPDDVAARDPKWCAETRVSKAGVAYDYLRLPGPQHRGAGIILLPRLHQQFLAGAQPFFFHHALFCIARNLAFEGFSVTVLNGPGSIGRGRLQREPATSYFADIRSAIHDLAHSLRAENCSAVGILAGSLAAVPVLRLLGPRTPFTACALLAPLLEASIPVTDPVRPDLLDDPLIAAFDDAAAKVEIPSLMVYGARDEVVPLQQISRLCERTLTPDIVELCVLEEEGHIFKQMSSWRHTSSRIESFFLAHLAGGASPIDGPAAPERDSDGVLPA